MKSLKYLQFFNLVAIISYLVVYGFNAYGIMLSIFLYFLFTGVGISITYHRYLTHKTFKYKYKILEYIGTILGALGTTGSSIAWVGIHRMHHRFVDTEKDPHSPRIGLAKQLALNYGSRKNVIPFSKDIIKDPFHRFIHNNYTKIVVLYAAVCYTIFGLYGLVYLYCIPAIFQGFVSVGSNYIDHAKQCGYRNYSTKDNSVNAIWWALITWGEGFHNNHHAKPRSYTFKKRWFELDISALVLELFFFLGLAKKGTQ